MAHGRRRRGRCTVLRLSDCIIVVVSMMATLVITHDERVLQFADAVFELDSGRLVQRA